MFQNIIDEDIKEDNDNLDTEKNLKKKWKQMDDIVDNFLNSLQSHIPSLEDDLEGEEEIFLEQVETVNFMNMGIDA